MCMRHNPHITSERKLRRQAKAAELWGHASRSRVRAALWEVFSLFVRTRDKRHFGGRCRIGEACHGLGTVEVAYHIVPQQRGDATRYDEDNVVGACRRCNRGEQLNRSKYREVHVRVFGRELVGQLEDKARRVVKLSTAELAELADKYRKKLEEGDYGAGDSR